MPPRIWHTRLDTRRPPLPAVNPRHIWTPTVYRLPLFKLLSMAKGNEFLINGPGNGRGRANCRKGLCGPSRKSLILRARYELPMLCQNHMLSAQGLYGGRPMRRTKSWKTRRGISRPRDAGGDSERRPRDAARAAGEHRDGHSGLSPALTSIRNGVAA